MALREAVVAEALDLLEDLLREGFVVAVGLHAPDDAVMELVHTALAAPGRHRAAQLVGLATAEAGGDHADLHHLLLEDGHAQRALQRHVQLRLGRLRRLQPLTAPQVGVHHAALDRPGPHDRDLDHQVVELARLQARQHALLRAALDLEHAHRVGPADHVEGGWVLDRDVGQAPAQTPPLRQQIERALERGEHAQRQHVYLQQAERFEVVLVPLDHAALRHGRVLDRHHARQLVARDHETADVLRQVAREADQGPGQLQPLPGDRGVGVEAGFEQPRRQLVPSVEPLVAPGQPVDPRFVQPERPAHVAHRAADAVGGQGRRQGGAVAAVAAVDVLDHFLAPLVLEVDVDVRRLIALAADEALEQQHRLHRVDRRDAQAEAHRRVGRRPTALAQDALRAGELHHVVHGEEEGLVLQLGDQLQLALDLPFHLRRYPTRIAYAGTGVRLARQVLDRRLAWRHDLGRVFVAQFAQLEPAPLRQRHAARQPLGSEQPCQRESGAQVLLAVARQLESALGHGALQADRGQRVEQRLARAGMHQHVAGRRQRHAAGGGEPSQPLGMRVVVGPAQQLDRDRGTFAEARGQPPGLGELYVLILVALWNQQRQAVGQTARVANTGQRPGQVIDLQPVAAFLAAAAAERDEAAQLRVALAVHRQQHQSAAGNAAAAVQMELAADHELERMAGGALLLERLVRPHHAGHRAFVGDRQGGVAELGRARDQFTGAIRGDVGCTGVQRIAQEISNREFTNGSALWRAAEKPAATAARVSVVRGGNRRRRSNVTDADTICCLFLPHSPAITGEPRSLTK